MDDSGADFIAAHAVDVTGVAWILRMPRRAAAADRAAYEHRVLAFLSGRLPAAIPEWRIFTPEMIAYPRLPGNPAAVVDLDAGGYVWRFDHTQPPPAFLETLGATLAALHAMNLEAARDAGLRVEAPGDARERWAEQIRSSRDVWTSLPPCGGSGRTGSATQRFGLGIPRSFTAISIQRT